MITSILVVKDGNVSTQHKQAQVMKHWNARINPVNPEIYPAMALHADKAALKADREGNPWLADMHRRAAIKARKIVSDAAERGGHLEGLLP